MTLVPLVSILIPCYNAERWIRQCIESALGQTYPDKEVIVVDDGSKDASLEVIKSFGDRIRWETGPNRGGNAARNRLLQLAQGEWLQYLDADDYLLPDKVSKQMEFIKPESRKQKVENEPVIVFGPMTMEYWSEGTPRQELLPIPEGHDDWVLLARWHLPGTGSGIWKKQAIIDAGAWDENQPCCQEHELYLRLLMAGNRFTICPHNGLIYRQWSEQTVCKRNKSEVHRRRLAIEERAENFLKSRGELTPERLWSINQARFEIARIAWQTDQAFAEKIMETILRSQPGFVPGEKAAPPLYRAVFRVLGFRSTELIADLKRTCCAGSKTTLSV